MKQRIIITFANAEAKFNIPVLAIREEKYTQIIPYIYV